MCISLEGAHFSPLPTLLLPTLPPAPPPVELPSDVDGLKSSLEGLLGGRPNGGANVGEYGLLLVLVIVEELEEDFLVGEPVVGVNTFGFIFGTLTGVSVASSS